MSRPGAGWSEKKAALSAVGQVNRRPTVPSGGAATQGSKSSAAIFGLRGQLDMTPRMGRRVVATGEAQRNPWETIILQTRPGRGGGIAPSPQPGRQDNGDLSFHGFRCAQPVSTFPGPAGADCRCAEKPTAATPQPTPLAPRQVEGAAVVSNAAIAAASTSAWSTRDRPGAGGSCGGGSAGIVARG